MTIKAQTLTEQERTVQDLAARMTERARFVLRQANAEAIREGANVVDSRDLLIAVAGDASAWVEADADALREASRAWGPSVEHVEGARGMAQVGLRPGEERQLRYTDELIITLNRSLARALANGQNYVGVPHLIAGLADENPIDASQVYRKAVPDGHGLRAVEAKLPLLPRSPRHVPRRASDTPQTMLVALLYVLMRDEVPTGRMLRIVRDVEQLRRDGLAGIEFSDRDLERRARSYAEKLS